jgi:hypothetical protein
MLRCSTTTDGGPIAAGTSGTRHSTRTHLAPPRITRRFPTSAPE